MQAGLGEAIECEFHACQFARPAGGQGSRRHGDARVFQERVKGRGRKVDQADFPWCRGVCRPGVGHLKDPVQQLPHEAFLGVEMSVDRRGINAEFLPEVAVGQ
ncbi:hypothetical protein D9M71_779760 [compost metagenome]